MIRAPGIFPITENRESNLFSFSWQQSRQTIPSAMTAAPLSLCRENRTRWCKPEDSGSAYCRKTGTKPGSFRIVRSARALPRSVPVFFYSRFQRKGASSEKMKKAFQNFLKCLMVRLWFCCYLISDIPPVGVLLNSRLHLGHLNFAYLVPLILWYP